MEGALLGHVGRGETGGSCWSTLQGLPGLPGALGLSLQMFLLCLQLLCQLLSLKEAALQDIPLGPVENHQTAGQSPSDPFAVGRTALAKARLVSQRINRGHIFHLKSVKTN